MLGEQQSRQSISAFRVKENSRSSGTIDPYHRSSRKEVSSYQRFAIFHPGLGYFPTHMESRGSRNILSVVDSYSRSSRSTNRYRKPVLHDVFLLLSFFLLSYSFFLSSFSFLFIDSTIRSSTKSISNLFLHRFIFLFGVLARWKARFRLDSIRREQDCCVATIRPPRLFR